MSRRDFTAYVGGWPFHYLPRSGVEDLRALHRDNRISEAWISSTDAIFYNDPYEADQRLASALAQAREYHLVQTVNPLLPGWQEAVKRGVQELGSAGVRLYPSFHGYRLTDACFHEACAYVWEQGLAVYVNLRMEDDRNTYLFHPRILPPEELGEFLRTRPQGPLMLANIFFGELFKNHEALLECPRVYADCSGLKDYIFVFERVASFGLLDRLVYGSLAPVFCMKPSVLALETDPIPEAARARIFSGSAWLHACGWDA